MPGINTDKVGRAGGALDLAISGAKGFQAARGIEDNAHHAYVIQLEENVDGRRRALLNIYDVFESSDSGKPVIQSSYGYIDNDGVVQREPFNFRYPTHDVVTSGDVSLDGVK